MGASVEVLEEALEETVQERVGGVQGEQLQEVLLSVAAERQQQELDHLH